MKKALNTEFLRYRTISSCGNMHHTMKSCGSGRHHTMKSCGSGEVEKFNKFDL